MTPDLLITADAPPAGAGAAAACIPAAELRPLVLDALSSIECALARERIRAATVQLVRARADMQCVLALLSDG